MRRRVWAMCSCEAACVCGHGVGGVARRKARAARVPLRPWKPPRPRPRARGNPLCVCVRHTARRTLRGVQLARQGRVRGWERREPARDTPQAAVDRRILVCVRATAGLEEGARLGAQERCASQRNRKFGGRGQYQRTKNQATGLPEPGGRAGSRRHASRPGPESLVRARLPSAARAPGQKKREKGGRPKGHRQPRRRTGCTPDPLFLRSSKRHAAPRARAGGHAARSSDCGAHSTTPAEKKI